MTHLHYHHHHHHDHLLCWWFYYFNYNERVLWTLSHLQNVCHSFLLDFGFHLQWATNFFYYLPFSFIYCNAAHIHIINITCIHLDLYIYSNIISYVWVCCQSFLIKRNQKVWFVFVLNAQLVACVFFLLCLYLISNTRICSIYIYPILYICSMYNSYKCLCSMSGVLFFVCLVCCLDLNIQNITLSQFHLYLSISLIAMSNFRFVFDFYIFEYIWNVHVHATITRICFQK